MTLLVSFFGFAGRMAGDLLTSALGWASSLLFGRVPRSHQVLVVLMMALSFLWVVFVLALLVPAVASFLVSTTPRPPFVNQGLLAAAIVAGVVALPLLVGVAGYLVPADVERPHGLGIALEILRGYAIAPLLSVLLVFLAGLGLARKARSRRHGWSDVHVPVVIERDGYATVVRDLGDAIAKAGLEARVEDAPRALTLPAELLSAVAGENVRRLRAQRLIELNGRDLRIGVYPSDIAISGTTRNRTRARAAALSGLTTTAAHLTTSAEGQRLEDAIGRVAKQAAGNGATRYTLDARTRSRIDVVDQSLVDTALSTDEWDILYRIRLEVERDLLVGAEPGMKFPGSAAANEQHEGSAT